MTRVEGCVGRCLAVWSAVTGVWTAAAAGLLDRLAAELAAPAGRPFEEWLVIGCELAALVATSWLWLLVGLVVVDAVRGTRRAGGVPPLLRRVVLAACGVGLAGGLGAPALASTSPSVLDGLPLPDRPAAGMTGARPAAGDVPHPSGPVPGITIGRAAGRVRVLQVRPGDSLWSLAAAQLPAGAGPAVVDEHWRAIHAANRDVIGEDPDLIRPGQLLRLPPPPPPSA